MYFYILPPIMSTLLPPTPLALRLSIQYKLSYGIRSAGSLQDHARLTDPKLGLGFAENGIRARFDLGIENMFYSPGFSHGSCKIP